MFCHKLSGELCPYLFHLLDAEPLGAGLIKVTGRPWHLRLSSSFKQICQMNE